MISFASRHAAVVALAVAVLSPAARLAAQSGVAMSSSQMTPPADRVYLSAERVREVLVERHPTVANGSSEDSSVTIVLTPAGEVVKTMSAKIVNPASPNAAGGAPVGYVTTIRSTNGDASPPSAAPAVVGGMSMNIGGLDGIAGRGIRDVYSTAYEAGVIGPRAMRVRFLVLAS